MTFPQNKRWWLWGIALVGSIILVVTGRGQSAPDTADTIARPSRAHVRHRQTVPQTAQDGPLLAATARPNMDVASADLFRRKRWYTPPPPPPKAPPPAPTAPPLPFTFLGKVKKPDGSVTFFISDQQRVYLVHGGETLRHQYHVDGISNGRLALTYLPLHKKQYLNLVGAH